MATAPTLTLDQLRAQIDSGDIDTVVVAFTDMQGRLQGKRLHGHYFLDHVLEQGTEGCNYLLAVEAFPHQPPLHVREGDDDGVDLAPLDGALECLEGQHETRS